MFLEFADLLLDLLRDFWFEWDRERENDFDLLYRFEAGDGENVWWFEVSIWMFDRINFFWFLLFDRDFDLLFLFYTLEGLF